MPSETDIAALEQVRNSLESVTLMKLRIESVDVFGAKFPSLRPTEVPNGAQTFNIVLTRSPFGVESYFVSDRFAGPMVRQMGERVNSQRSNWGDLEIDFESTGVAVDIRVDGFPFDMGAMVPSPWKSLEIESRKRLPRRADFDEVVDAWSSVAGASLCLVLSALSIDFPPEYPDGLIEGARITVQSTRSERNPVNRYRSIQHYGRTCWACDIDFAAVYGELGGDFIEVHHIFPLAGLENPRPVDPIREMVPLCSNCHSMAHRLSPPVHPIRLREILNLEPKESIFLEL